MKTLFKVKVVQHFLLQDVVRQFLNLNKTLPVFVYYIIANTRNEKVHNNVLLLSSGYRIEIRKKKKATEKLLLSVKITISFLIFIVAIVAEKIKKFNIEKTFIIFLKILIYFIMKIFYSI